MPSFEQATTNQIIKMVGKTFTIRMCYQKTELHLNKFKLVVVRQNLLDSNQIKRFI